MENMVVFLCKMNYLYCCLDWLAARLMQRLLVLLLLPGLGVSLLASREPQSPRCLRCFFQFVHDT